MSEFFRALGQAERDRALREQGRGRPAAPPVEEPTVEAAVPVEQAPPTEDATAMPTAPTMPANPRQPALETAPVERRQARRRRVDTSDVTNEGLDGHLVSLVTPATFEAEQYRALRHMIEELHANSGVGVVAISSPSVGDGKTTTAINLAGALAQSPDTRVLLVDADLRRPAVGEKLGLQITPSPGLVGLLLDRALPLSSAVRRRSPFSLDILPAGDTPVAPYEVLRSPRFADLMKDARSYYNYVIVDTPPLVGVPDCRVVASVVDGFVIVVAAHRTPKRLVEDALSVVESGKIIGLLYNRDDRPLSGYYQRAYAGQSANGNGHRKWPWGGR